MNNEDKKYTICQNTSHLKEQVYSNNYSICTNKYEDEDYLIHMLIESLNTERKKKLLDRLTIELGFSSTSLDSESLAENKSIKNKK